MKDLQFINDDYNFEFLTEIPQENRDTFSQLNIPRTSIGSNLPFPQPFEVSSLLDLDYDQQPSIEIDLPSIDKSIQNPFEKVMNDNLLHEEDNEYLQSLDNQNQTKEQIHHVFNLQVDRRISLDSDEIRNAIQDAEDYVIERPVCAIQSNNQSSKELYYTPSIQVSTGN